MMIDCCFIEIYHKYSDRRQDNRTKHIYSGLDTVINLAYF